MLVRHLHALRRSGGTGSVYDGAQVGLLDRFDAFVEFLIGHACAVGLELVQAAGIDGDDMLQRRAFLDGPIGLLAHIGVLHDKQPGIGIVHDVANLLRGISVVDGGQHAADGHDGSVGEVPFVAGAAHERHTVALLQAVFHQSLGDGAGLGKKLIGGPVYPFVAVLVGVQNVVSAPRRAIGIQVVD